MVEQRKTLPPVRLHRIAVLGLVASLCAFETAAEQKISAGFVRGITRTDQLPSADLRLIRKRMVSHRAASYRQLQLLADRGDGLAAMMVAKQLYGEPALAGDAIHYFTIAASTGRSGAVKPLIALLGRIDGQTINPVRIDAAERILKRHAAKGDIAAAEGLLRLYGRGRPFVDSDRKHASMRASAADQGNTDAALQEAMALLSLVDGRSIHRKKIETYLQIAASAQDLKTRSVAASLISGLNNTSTATPEDTP